MKPKRCWQYVDRPGAIKNLPPFCYVAAIKEIGDVTAWQIQPDVDMAIEECPNYDNVDDDYRGLAVQVSDHGNVELLRCFANGKTRSIWGCV